ncbi:HypC/HybG/HupF family hydrogenase formation chaperone [Thermomicrobium roseum]|jgi:hydrogenase expression/formation protein HypC|uniref:Hydrogenase maturation factor n=1 Tax=Thermomicrobium roseum (strain ATCC 27502 / DSM 5159 / P-2) TaxID=309801 RepID=B9L1W8_THERP|nr:HypC/HybG/HupF family hydrogenase formation chaperone [Thermomicrobium roseum]ACM05612.1 hydrogenase maturation factor [Thermomicrobium roseum DSM 5159]
MRQTDVHPELWHYGSCTLDRDGCVTCGDLAVPVVVVAVEGNQAVCEDRVGQRAIVALDFVPDVMPGDVLLVHLGVALVRVGGDDAIR